jgi:hypothetical protein
MDDKTNNKPNNYPLSSLTVLLDSEFLNFAVSLITSYLPQCETCHLLLVREGGITWMRGGFCSSDYFQCYACRDIFCNINCMLEHRVDCSVPTCVERNTSIEGIKRHAPFVDQKYARFIQTSCPRALCKQCGDRYCLECSEECEDCNMEFHMACCPNWGNKNEYSFWDSDREMSCGMHAPEVQRAIIRVCTERFVRSNTVGVFVLSS